MKVAVTADCHLTSRKEHPERFETLEILLHDLGGKGIRQLIIAGDLFDKDYRNYGEFEGWAKKAAEKKIDIHIIPGNHDASLSGRNFTASNVFVYNRPELKSFDLMSLPLLFLPYYKDRSMGEAMAVLSDPPEQGWILVGHGDWLEGAREVNGYEPGVYMPLTRNDLDRFRPEAVLLGHIHKPLDQGMVHYPGSPCPLEINETGRRRYLLVDTESAAVSEQILPAIRLFFRADLTALPVADEKEFIRKQIDNYLNAWQLSSDEKKKALIRVAGHGYSHDRSSLADMIKDGFQGLRFYDPEGPRLEQVSLVKDGDADLVEVAAAVQKRVESLDWPERPDSPDKGRILQEALKNIFGD